MAKKRKEDKNERRKKQLKERAARVGKLEKDVVYALLDTKDNLWLGEKGHVRTYDSKTLAKIAARVIDVQLGWPAGRSRAVPYDGSATRVRDEVPVLVDSLTAVQRLEEGKVL